MSFSLYDDRLACFVVEHAFLLSSRITGRFIREFMCHFFVSSLYDRLFLHLHDDGTRPVVKDLL